MKQRNKKQMVLSWVLVLTLIASSFSGMLITSKAADKEYMEYTFGDIGISDGTYTANKFGTLNITSFDKVAFTGEIQFSNGGTSGGRLGIVPNEGNWSGLMFCILYEGLYIQNFLNNGDFELKANTLGLTDAGELTSKAMKLHIAFDKASETETTVTVTVNDTHSKKKNVPTTSLESCKTILVNGTADYPVTVKSVKKTEGSNEPVKGPYTDYSFNDIGFTDGEYSAFIPKELDVETLDKVTFEGKVTFKEANGTPGFGFCTSGSGIGIKYVCADGNIYIQDFTESGQAKIITYSDLGYANGEELLNKEHTIKTAFDKDGDKMIVTVTINDKVTEELRFDASKLENYKYVFVQGTEGHSIKIGSIGAETEPEKSNIPEGPYKEYTFYNLGLANGLYQEARVVDWNIENYDKVAFTGEIAISKSNLDAGLVLAPNAGQWGGINIGISRDNNSVYFQNYLKTGEVDFTFEELGFDDPDEFYGKFIKVRLLFNEKNEKIRMTIVLNDTLTKCIDFTSEQLAGLTAFVVRATEDKPVIIKSVYVGDNKEPEKQPVIKEPEIYDTPRKSLSSYSDFTFSTLRMEDGLVKEEAKSGILTTINGKVFKGKITFPGEGLGSITVGGNSVNRWFGVHIETVDGGLIFYESANGAQKWKISKETIGRDITNKEIELYLTFDCKDDNNVYIGVYVDGKFCGERLYCDLQEPFGGAVLVYSAEAGIKIASVATAWQRFIMSNVNLNYFGFSNTNWKTELKQRCR